MMFFQVTLLFCIVIGCLAAPIDDPVRIDLPVYNKPNTDDQSQAANANLEPQYLPENHPGGEPLNYNVNFIAGKLQALNSLGKNHESQGSFLGGPFADPVTKIESAVHETEGPGSRVLSFKENIQGVVAGLFQPEPIVDTISESEKYGNNGDKFRNAGQALVNGAAGVSNLVNSVLEVPGALLRIITRVATEKLNNLGGKFIGL